MASKKQKIPKYKVGEFVEVLRDGVWCECIIETVTINKQVLYQGYILDTAWSFAALEKHVRPAKEFQQMLVQELSQEMPDLTQKTEVQKILEEESKDAVNFVSPPPVKPSKRFKSLSEQDLDDLEYNSKAKNTHKHTKWGVGVFTDWLAENGIERQFEQLDEDILAGYLRRFYGEAKTKDGVKYSKSSLLGMRASIQRYLSGGKINRDVNIVSGPKYKKANDVLSGQLREMKKNGEDVSQSHTPIKPFDIEKMYSSGTLSDSNPTSLQYKVFFEVCLHFGRRGREGLRELRKDHFIFKRDDAGVNYVTLSFNSLEKNRQGINLKEAEHDQRLYGTGCDNCPLLSLQKYINLLSPECPFFFQRPKTSNWSKSVTWFINSPVGQNTIAKFMSRISEKAGLSEVYTNHCIRSTTVTNLRNLGTHVNDIMAVTGHKCAQSLMAYSSASSTARREMSHALSASTGYTINKVAPHSAIKRQPSAALGKAPTDMAVAVKPAISETSTPNTKPSFSLPLTPGKIANPSKFDTELLLKKTFSFALDMSPNKKMSSQVLAIDTSQRAVTNSTESKSLFPQAVFNGCTINILQK